MPKHRKRKNLFGLGKRTYSAATGISRPVLKDKRQERKLRRLEAKEAARLHRKSGLVKPKVAAKVPAKAMAKMPSLFGTAYEKLSPSQQELVRKAMVHNKANPKKSFAACVKAVSKRKGVTSPKAVCAASKMRTAKGKRELLAAAKQGRKMAMSRSNPFETMRQGKAKAQIFQVGPHQFIVEIGDEAKEFKSYVSAQAWARIRLHEVTNPKGVKVRVYKRTPGARKNPLDSAAKLYEEFHGFPSSEVIEFVEQVHYHSALASIGPLISMVVRNGSKEATLAAPDPAVAGVEDVIFLTSTEDGRQLIPVGGDQKIPIKDLMGKFGLNAHDVRDHMLIGEITQITYRTRKSFEAGGEEEIDFYHDLGKEHSRGALPVLIYKPRNPSLEIAGGRYFIGKPERNLGGVSPGIVG